MDSEYSESDYWEFRPATLVRVHIGRRKMLFFPDRCNDPPPIPLHHVDVTRRTRFDVENDDGREIVDLWDGSQLDAKGMNRLVDR